MTIVKLNTKFTWTGEIPYFGHFRLFGVFVLFCSVLFLFVSSEKSILSHKNRILPLMLMPDRDEQRAMLENVVLFYNVMGIPPSRVAAVCSRDTMASQITSLTTVCSTAYSGADQRNHQSSALLAFVWGIHRGPVNSLHIWPVTRKMLPFDDVIMCLSEVYYSDGVFIFILGIWGK